MKLQSVKELEGREVIITIRKGRTTKKRRGVYILSKIEEIIYFYPKSKKQQIIYCKDIQEINPISKSIQASQPLTPTIHEAGSSSLTHLEEGKGGYRR